MKLKHATFSEALSASTKGAPTHLKVRAGLGRGIISAGSGALNAVDRAGTGLAKTLLAPGGELSGAIGSAAGDMYTGLRDMSAVPGARWAAVGIPAALVFNQQAGDRTNELAQNAIQEGRQVYASDKSFVEKKASLEQQLREKTAAPGGFLQGLAGLGGKTLAGNGMVGGALLGGGLGQLGNALGSLTGQSGDTFGYRMNRSINPLTDRVKADETFASSFFQTAGSEVAKGLAGLLKDMAGKAVSAATQGPAHAAMVQNLSASDGTISRADPALLANAYHTMQKFAPTLATDENAVRSFLREAVMAGNGPDYASIANLAKAESAIVGPIKRASFLPVRGA